MHYFYNFEYGEPKDHLYKKGSTTVISPLLFDVRVFALADRLLIPSLKDLSAEKFTRQAESGWNTPAFAVAISEI